MLCRVGRVTQEKEQHRDTLWTCPQGSECTGWGRPRALSLSLLLSGPCRILLSTSASLLPPVAFVSANLWPAPLLAFHGSILSRGVFPPQLHC